MTVSIIFNKVLRKIRQLLIRLSFDKRPSSAPYISGDSFRKLTKYHHEKNNFLDPHKIKEKCIIFVESDLLIDFFENIHNKINYPYVLLSHNSDTNIDESFLKYIDEKIIHWFTQNLLLEHPKITVLPIGLENAYYANAGRINLYINEKKEVTKRNGRILVGFSVGTNKEIRSRALNELKKNPLVDVLNKRITQEEYVKLLKQYSFVASPPGNGIDCIRTWEAILMGTVPICLDNTNSKLFKKIKAPIKMVSSYLELENKDISKLQKEYTDITSNSDQSVIYLKYWEEIIKSKLQ